jgi:hypothetical protein
LEGKTTTQSEYVLEEIKDEIEPFLKLSRLSKAKGMSASYVNNILEIANNNLPSIEERFKRLRNDINMLQFRKHTLERDLRQLNNQIATTTNILILFICLGEKKKRQSFQ